MLEVLTPTEMAEADRRAAAAGPHDGTALMQRAGGAVASVVMSRFPAATSVAVLCGPGNNGGDGYVAAESLRTAGVSVRVFAEGTPREASDAATAASRSDVPVLPLADFKPSADMVVVDALYGAGLARDVSDHVRAAIAACRQAKCAVVAVDLPSGVSGDSGKVLGAAFDAALTITFVRKKPGHLLQPGRRHCGEVLVADIGMPEDVVASLGVTCRENLPALWQARLPWPSLDAHKYSRGHVAVFGGNATATGAARLAAMAAARAGAGAVTLLSPAGALAVNAMHITSIMLRRRDEIDDTLAFMAARKVSAVVYGPGLDQDATTAATLVDLLGRVSAPTGVVVDASALTAVAVEPQPFFKAVSAHSISSSLVLTPHEGEFARLFPDLAENASLSKLERARTAASRAGAVVVLKGPDTVIAAPDGRAAINSNGTPLLATAGSGDVLSGIVAGLLAQGMAGFEATCAAVWMHAEAARGFGPGLIAEDLPGALVPVLGALHAKAATG